MCSWLLLLVCLCMYGCLYFFFYKQKTAYEMRISDWSSDVCSSDLGNAILDGMAGLWCVQVGYGRKELADAAYDQMLELPYYNTFFKTATPPTIQQIGRASWRERVCQYV